MQRHEKKNEKEKRLILFQFIIHNLRVCVAYVDMFQNKKVPNLKKEKKEILSFLHLVVKDIEYILEKEEELDELELGSIGL